MSDPRQKRPTNDRIDALPPAPTKDALSGPRADLARAIPRRMRVSWWLGIVLAAVFTILVTPAITAERWLASMGVGEIVRGEPAPLTVRVPPFRGYDTALGHTGGGGVLIARGDVADRDTAAAASELAAAQPHGAVHYLAFLLLVGVLAGLFTHHVRRSTQGRLLRVQLVSLALIVAAAVAVKLLMLTTALSVLVVPVAVFAMVPTLVLDRVVGLATGTLAALVVSFLVPFDVGVAVMLMVQAGAAGLMIAERPKRCVRTVVIAGAFATLFTAATYPLMLYLSAGRLPIDELGDPLHSAWIAAAVGPAIATALTIACFPLYQLAVGEITHGKLVELEDLSHPLLRQIAEKAPGTWQHSLTMANMAEIAANAIGANGRLVRVGAYFHDLGKSLNPKYFIENLEPGETSPHDNLAPDASCDAIFRHVTEGILAARRAGLHERIIDFMHMHHGNGVLEYFWAKCREQGNPKGLTVEHFRYPGVPPQTRETAILSICDAVEAGARTLKKPDSAAIDSLVQRIVYGKLHVGQLDESGLSMSDLRRITESLRDTIRHANHGRIEYPWQTAKQDATATTERARLTQTGPRLDSLDRPARAETVPSPPARITADALAETDAVGVTPKHRAESRDPAEIATTAPVVKQDLSDVEARLRGPLPTDNDITVPAPKQDLDEVVELRPKPEDSLTRMRRPTNPLAERTPSPEAEQFVAEANAVLGEASKELAASRPKAVSTPAHDAPATAADSAPVIEIVANEPDVTLAPRDTSSAHSPAASGPPTEAVPPTTPAPVARTTPPPPPGARPPEASAATSNEPRPRAPSTPNVTVPPPAAIRPPGINYLDDMITLRPQYEPRRDPSSTDGAAARTADDAGATHPQMALKSAWARDLAARIDAQLDEDFGTETPIAAPTRAELQAMLDAAPDPTRKQSLEELELLHAQARADSEELDLRRRPAPTSEIEDADIEAAIELAPPARRTAIGVAKKKPED